jgi:hypothetical protein
MVVPPPAGSERVVARPGVEQPALRLATADDVSRLAGVFADAFINDPMFTWLLPGSLRRKPRLRTMFAAELELYAFPNGGTVWTTSGYDGAVTVLPPGAWEMPKSATGLHMDVLELPEGGPPLWRMRRPPAGASRAEA